MKKEINNFKTFIKEYKIVIAFLFFISLVTYGIKLFQYSISIDTEVLINTPMALLKSWIGINRPVLVFLKGILGFHPFNVFLAQNITYVFFTSYSIILFYLFYRMNSQKQKQKWKLLIFGSIILTSAHYIEQLNFTLQSAEIAIMLNVCIIGLLFLNVGIEKRKKLYLFISTICIALCFGSYQSFVPLYMTLVCLCLFINIKEKNYKWFSVLEYLKNSFLVFILSLIGYIVIGKLSQMIFSVEPSSYLTNKIFLFDEPVIVTIKRIIFLIINGYIGAINHKELFYSFVNTLALIGMVVYITKIIFKNDEKQKVLKILISFIILLVPFSLSILLGNYELYRAQLSLPIVIAFICSFINVTNLKNEIEYIFLTLVIVCIGIQYINTNKLLSSDYFRYQEDVNYANILYERLSEYDLENKRVVMLGKYMSDNPQITLKGETMGHSFFLWDQYEPTGVGVRAAHFMRTLGYNINGNTAEDYKIAMQFESDLEIFPKENSIMEYQDLVIVKLSE